MTYVGKKPADIIATAVDTTTGTFSGDLTVDTNTLYVDSANNRVGVGTVSPAYDLHIHQNDSGNALIHFTNTGTGSTGTDGFTVGIDASEQGFVYMREAKPILFATNNSEAMRIDSSGNVGIGVVPETDWSSTGTALQIGGMGFICGHDGTGDLAGALMWGSNARQTSGWGGTSNWKYIANEQSAMYQTGDGRHRFFVAGAGSADATITWNEAVNIDNSGNLLVGKTSADSNTEGVFISTAGGGSNFVRAGTSTQPNVIFNKKTNDGEILQFRKDNATVGSIGSISGTGVSLISTTGTVQIGSSDAGLVFNGAGNYILPWNVGANTSNDGGVDLGASTHRFKDLYLSGGVYLGGTGSANYLDDYETGTFTFTIGFSSADPTAGASSYTGYYVKIGQLCTMYGVGSNINVTGGSGDIRIRGLPFTAISDGISGQSSYSGVSGSGKLNVDAGCCSLISDQQDNVDYGRIIEILDDSGNDVINAANCNHGTTDITFTLTVPVA